MSTGASRKRRANAVWAAAAVRTWFCIAVRGPGLGAAGWSRAVVIVSELEYRRTSARDPRASAQLAPRAHRPTAPCPLARDLERSRKEIEEWTANTVLHQVFGIG
jgi:hypothetical protein